MPQLKPSKSLLTIGSDPEIQLVSPLSNEDVPANNFISDTNCNKPFGVDGHSSTAEIRPVFATSPLIHANHIKALLFKHAKITNFQPIYNLSFYASSPRTSIGGHIHFGHPLIAINHNLDYENNDNIGILKDLMETFSIPESIFRDQGNYEVYKLAREKVNQNIKKLVDNLDMLLGFPTMYLEIKTHAEKRKRGSYGHLTEYREQVHGIEYRTPPCWLSTERLAQGILSLAYSIAYDTLENDYQIRNNIVHFGGFSDSFNLHRTQLLKPYLSLAREETRKLTLYPKYKKYIDYFFYHAQKEDEILATEIKLGWSIPYNILKNITLFTVKELVGRVAEALTVPKGMNENSTGKTYISRNSDDFMIPEITGNINSCLDAVIKTHQERINGVYIYAKKREAGDIISIKVGDGIDWEKIDRLPKLIADITKAFNYPRPIQVTTDHWNNQPSPSNGVVKTARVGIGRAIREQKNYLAEAIIFTILLYVNNSIYQAYKFDRKTGRRTTLPLAGRSIVKQLKETLVGKIKKTPKLREDTEETEEENRASTRYSYIITDPTITASDNFI